MYKNEKVTEQCDITVVKVDGEWLISNQNMSLLFGAVFGELLSSLSTLSGSLFK